MELRGLKHIEKQFYILPVFFAVAAFAFFSGVGLVVDLFELLRGEVGIDLSSRKRLMAEQLLNASQIGAVIEHMRREAVPERMRADIRVEAGHLQVFIHLSANAAGAEAPAVLINEEDIRIEIGVAGGPFVSEFHIVLDDLQGGGADWRDSLFFALSSDVDDFAEKVDIVHIQGDKLADPHTGAVKCFHNGAVSCSEPVVHRRGFEQPFNLFVFEEARQLLVLLGRSDGHNGIRAELFSLDEKLVEASQGRKLSGYGRLGIVFLVEMSQVCPDGIDVDSKEELVDLQIRPRCDGGSGALLLKEGAVLAGLGGIRAGHQELAELAQVSTVAFGRVLGKPFFKFEVIEKIVDNRTIFHNRTCLFIS